MSDEAKEIERAETALRSFVIDGCEARPSDRHEANGLLETLATLARKLLAERDEARDEAREEDAKYMESTFGRCNLLAANGYLNGDDVAANLRALKSKRT